jgi:hypothetical protein
MRGIARLLVAGRIDGFFVRLAAGLYVLTGTAVSLTTTFGMMTSSMLVLLWRPRTVT